MSKLMVGQTTEASAASPKSLESPAESTTQLSLKDRMAILTGVAAQLNKDFGIKHSIVRLGDRVGRPMPSIPFGCPTVDKDVLGCGGIPRGRITELIGPESSGKTTIALEIVAQDQKAGGLCAYVDMEHALDPTYAAELGVDVDNLLVSQPDYGEQALDIVEALVRSKAVSTIVIDSVAALVPKAELEGDMGDSHMGLQARLMSQACRKLNGLAEKNGVTLIFINQIREKIGVMFGSPETTTGGRALRFYSSVRLDIRRKEVIKDGDVEIGHRIQIKAVKNKVGTPKKFTEVDLLYHKGLDREADLLTYAVRLEVVEKSGAWYSFKGERMGQGAENAKDYLKDPVLLKPVLAAIEVAEAKEKSVDEVA